MKRLLSILFVFSTLPVLAELPVTTNATFVRFASSYDTSPYHLYGDYLDSAMYLYFPRLNIHCYPASRGGGSIEDANETRLERRGLALWANGSQSWGIIVADDNGGYTSNNVIANVTNTFNAPALFFNGTAYTNEGGWAATNTIHWIGVGAIPGNTTAGDSSEQVRNNAMTNAATLFAYSAVDSWYPLYNGGWSNDFSSGAGLIQWHPQSHPGTPGHLDMALVIATNWLDTNINTCTLDWNTGTTSATNHCVVTSASRTGNIFTFNWKADRHSMAFDVPDGTITNDATPGFTIIPPLTNAFFEVLRITNMPAGNYLLNEDGSNILAATSDQLAAGVNLFTIAKGAVWAQRKEVLGRIRDKHHTDRVTLLDGSAGDNQGDVSYDSYAQAYWDSGYRGDALITQLAAKIANLNSYDDLIHSAAIPTNHTFTISLPQPIFAPFHR